VIILSSWAVVKIPMLINEAKFLGLTFMVVRWILTVISIMIFAWIMGKIVKDSDLPQEELEVSAGVIVNRNACMGCTVCTKNYPEVFEMKGKKASVKDYLNLDMELLKNTIEACPVKAIDYN
jgi:ferredoxin